MVFVVKYKYVFIENFVKISHFLEAFCKPPTVFMTDLIMMPDIRDIYRASKEIMVELDDYFYLCLVGPWTC